MTDRELLELIASQVGKLTDRVDTLTEDMAEVKANMATKDELAAVKATVIRIEIDHGQKLGALFDGQKLNSEKLDRIEAEVIRHDELILKQIK
jgi:hypothetical protein